ncbi:MAG TPA: hypothetical protein VNK48_05445 [Xanthobacteraceae bacterium]|nr:hypothetical protein [Xanthobacteraceae bacterium]
MGGQSSSCQRSQSLHCAREAAAIVGGGRCALRQPAARAARDGRRGAEIRARHPASRRRARRPRRHGGGAGTLRSGDRGGYGGGASGGGHGAADVGAAAVCARLALDARRRTQPLVSGGATVPAAAAGRLGQRDRPRAGGARRSRRKFVLMNLRALRHRMSAARGCGRAGPLQ